MTRSATPVGPRSAGRTAAFALGCVVALVVLRLLQLRTVAPLLYSPELFRMSSLAWDIETGALADASLWEQISTYQYMRFAQGTLVVQGAFAVLSRATGPQGWAFHAVGVGFEALTIGAVAALAARRVDLRVAAVLLLPWLLPPAFVVAWQLMPYGNHTEFLAIPVLLGAATLATPETPRRAVGLAALIAVGVVLYRPVGVAALAFAAAMATAPRSVARRAVTATIAGLAGAGAVVALLAAAWTAPVLGGDPGSAVLPRLEPGRYESVSRALAAWADATPFFAVPRGAPPLGLGLVAATLAGCAALAARRGPDGRFGGFCAAWGLASAALAVLLAPPHPEYLLAVWYAGLLGLVALTDARTGRIPAMIVAAALGAGGALDARQLVQPSHWAATAEYDGVRFARELRLDLLDVDEIGSWSMQRGAQPALATAVPGRLAQPLRHDPGPLPDPSASRDAGWGRGELATRITAAREARTLGAGDLRAVGRAAWVVCDQDLGRVADALDGLDHAAREHALSGARLEAARAAARRDTARRPGP